MLAGACRLRGVLEAFELLRIMSIQMLIRAFRPKATGQSFERIVVKAYSFLFARVGRARRGRRDRGESLLALPLALLPLSLSFRGPREAWGRCGRVDFVAQLGVEFSV